MLMLQPDQNDEPRDAVHRETLTALSHLIECRRGKLIRNAQRITGNREEAEDVVQETALKALLNLHHFRGDAQIYTWLYSIVTNSAIDRLRSPQRRRSVSLETELQGADPSFFHTRDSVQANPEQACAEGELHTILHGEIEQLRPMYRSAIELCDIDECTYDDAAKFLNISISTVKSRLFRGRRLLRQRVHQYVLTRPTRTPCKSPSEPSEI